MTGRKQLGGLLVGMLLLVLYGTSWAQEAATELKLGDLAPGFTLQTSEGERLSLIQFRNTKPVLIEFFLTTCPHCRRSSGWIQYLYTQEGGKLQVLAINADNLNLHKNTTAGFRKQFKVTYPILENPPLSLIKAYQFSTFPFVGIVSPQGRLLYTHQGEILPHDVVEIEKALRTAG